MIPAAWWPAIAGGIALAVAGVWSFIGHLLRRADKAEMKNLRADAEANERMNDADLGIGATDGERRKRLSDYADRHGG